MSNTTLRIKRKAGEIISSRHGLAEVMRFEDYASKYDNSCYHLLEDNRQSMVLSAEFFGEQHKLPEPCKLPDMYWVALKNAKIVGGSDVVFAPNGKLLYDMLARCNEYSANMTDYGLFLLFGRPHHIGQWYVYNFQRKKGNPIDKGICLASNMSNNYFHFMFQVASKMGYISKTGIGKDVPLLVDERVLRVPQMYQTLDLLNEDKREVIPLKANTLYEVGDLYCIGNPNIVVPNSKSKFQTEKQNNAFVYDAKALSFVKSKILSLYVEASNIQKLPKRIYLSRKNCNKRQINEEELHSVLNKYGFEFVYTETMDITAQARLFQQAEHIIGASGAAFTNLLFCSKNTHVLLFLSRHHNSTCFSSLGHIMGAKMMFIAGTTNNTRLHTPFFSINPETLEEYLRSIYSN